MIVESNELYEKLQQKPKYEKFLYRYGFFITDSTENYDKRYSFLKPWNRFEIRNLHFWIHPDQKLYVYETEAEALFLIGHCYDPIAMIASESDILLRLADALRCGQTEYCRELANLTGIFVTGYIAPDGVHVYGDAAGMFMTYYGVVAGKMHIASHADLIGNLSGLRQRDYVQRLVRYRFYPLFGRTLPGDISPYDGFRRLVPNHTVQIHNGTCRVTRFYPTENWQQLLDELSLDERVQKITQILKNTMALIPRKWERPAVSLTGGCDSKTTLACAVDQYQNYRYFSYVSQEAEKVDADGAHVICEKLGLTHAVYTIPEISADDEELVIAGSIIAANQGNIGRLGDQETRKRVYLSELDVFDVEVKSWVSEIARAYYHKRFAKTDFPAKPTPRYLTTLYKVFAHDRKLVKETDRIFAEYMEKYLQEEQLCGWSWLDLFFWEFRMGSWNGLVITGEHRYSGEITIPYNNRRLMELMMAVPVKMRMEDKLYEMIRAEANPSVDAAGVAITNLKHTQNRAKLERLYLEVHSRV